MINHDAINRLSACVDALLITSGRLPRKWWHRLDQVVSVTTARDRDVVIQAYQRRIALARREGEPIRVVNAYVTVLDAVIAYHEGVRT
jgi:hypothetical protein